MSILTSKQTWQRTYSGRRKPNAALSPIEQANVRRAVIFLRARYESPAELARALGLTIEALWKARSKRRPQSLRLAFLVARAAFRATLHKNLDDTNEHQQVVDYVGGKPHNNKPKRAGRKWPNHCGLVGRVIREGKLEPAISPMGPHVLTHEQYVEELIALYGYDDQQARALQSMRLGALAIPIMSNNKVIGVVYCDSTDRDFFDHDTVELCVQTSFALTQLIHSIHSN